MVNEKLSIAISVESWALMQTLLHTHIAKQKESLKVGSAIYHDDYLDGCNRAVSQAEKALEELAEAAKA